MEKTIFPSFFSFLFPGNQYYFLHPPFFFFPQSKNVWTFRSLSSSPSVQRQFFPHLPPFFPPFIHLDNAQNGLPPLPPSLCYAGKAVLVLPFDPNLPPPRIWSHLKGNWPINILPLHHSCYQSPPLFQDASSANPFCICAILLPFFFCGQCGDMQDSFFFSSWKTVEKDESDDLFLFWWPGSPPKSRFFPIFFSDVRERPHPPPWKWPGCCFLRIPPSLHGTGWPDEIFSVFFSFHKWFMTLLGLLFFFSNKIQIANPSPEAKVPPFSFSAAPMNAGCRHFLRTLRYVFSLFLSSSEEKGMSSLFFWTPFFVQRNGAQNLKRRRYLSHPSIQNRPLILISSCLSSLWVRRNPPLLFRGVFTPLPFPVLWWLLFQSFFVSPPGSSQALFFFRYCRTWTPLPPDGPQSPLSPTKPLLYEVTLPNLPSLVKKGPI